MEGDRRATNSHTLDEIIRLGYQQKNQKLIDAGFNNLKLNLSLLQKTKGNLEQVFQILSERCSKRAQDDEDVESEEESDSSTHTQNFPLNLQQSTQLPDYNVSDIKAKQKLEGYKRSQRTETVSNYDVWPDEVRKVFLDGNNMLFVDKSIRKLRLSQRQKEAERTLANLAYAFAGGKMNFHTVLVFDNTQQCVKDWIQAGDKPLEFMVCSANPHYKTSDDALVDWLAREQNLKECLVVTSDRELQQRLKNLGPLHIMKTGNWFSIVRAAIGPEIYDRLVDYKI